MIDTFGPIYADAYEFLYQDKDYVAECDLLEHIFRNYGDGAIHSVLDLGCGTGNHALLLAQRDYEVVGVDRSERMISHAMGKQANLSRDTKVVFLKEDVRNFVIERHFDTALMMFAVLSYQLENEDVISFLRTARRHLRSGGILIFDAWYGPAVLYQRPAERIKVIQTPEGQILRAASGELDTRRQVCMVHYRLWRFTGDQLVAETRESHSMRYFFPLELDLLLQLSGFSPRQLRNFPDFDREPDETTWNVIGVAQAT